MCMQSYFFYYPFLQQQVLLAIFLFFLFPSIIGASVFRDYKSNMHSILYSYPFSKFNYLSAKFLSSFFVVLLIIIIAGIGLFIGFRLPGTNQEIVRAFNFSAYLHSYLIYIIPNVLLFGAIDFQLLYLTLLELKQQIIILDIGRCLTKMNCYFL